MQGFARSRLRRSGARTETAADCGSSFVEVLISLVLLGTAVVAILVMVQTSIRATTTDRTLANSYEYIQAVSDQIYAADRVPCYEGAPAVAAAYDAAAKAAAQPPGWSRTASVTGVEFLGRDDPDDPFSWGSFCFESSTTTDPYYTSPLYTQKITFTVTGPDGTAKTLQVVKSAK